MIRADNTPQHATQTILGPIQLIFYSVGIIVGAGVYSVIGAAAGLAQHHLWIGFLVGAGVALLTAISYAEMATAFPAAGAEYVYIRRAWPSADWLAFASGPSFSQVGPRPRRLLRRRSVAIYGSLSICPRQSRRCCCWLAAPR